MALSGRDTVTSEDALARLADGDLRNLEYWAREAYTADHLPLTDGGQDNVARFRSMLTSEVVLSLIAELRIARAAARGEPGLDVERLLRIEAAAQRAEDAMSVHHDRCDEDSRCFDIEHANARNGLRVALRGQP